MAPAGQLWSTAEDLCRWATFLAGGHDGVLSRRHGCRDARARGRPQSADSWTDGYGLGHAVAARGRPHPRRSHRLDARIPCDGMGQRRGSARRNRDGQHDDRYGVGPWPRNWSHSRGARAADAAAVAADGRRRSRTARADRPVVLGRRTRSASTCARVAAWKSSRSPARARVAVPRRADGTWTGLDAYYTGETLRAVRDGGCGDAPRPGHIRVDPRPVRPGRTGARQRRCRRLARYAAVAPAELRSSEQLQPPTRLPAFMIMKK